MKAEAEVLFFGVLAELTGMDSIRLWDVEDTDSVEKIIVDRFPVLSSYTYLLALDKRVIHANHPLTNSHVVAFMPPFSGG